MANKENSKNGIGIGEIGTIRNILMGDQMSAYEARFKELEGQLNASQAKISETLKGQTSQLGEDIKNLQKSLESQMQSLQESLEVQKKAITQMGNNNNTDKEKLGRLLIELGNQIMNK